MRKGVLILALVVALILDAGVFSLPSLRGVGPDVLIALFVSLGVLAGIVPLAAVAAATGALVDILFNGYIGLTTLALLGAVVAGGLFYNRFYADNIIIPALIAAAFAFVWEHCLLAVVLIRHGRLGGYFSILIAHIVPCALLSGLICAIMHLILKKTLFSPERRRDIDHLHRRKRA